MDKGLVVILLGQGVVRGEEDIVVVEEIQKLTCW